MTPSETLIRRYYDAFNERRLEDAAGLFAPDAVLEQVQRPQPERGRQGYMRFADVWLTAFPDAVLTVRGIVSRDERTHEVSLVADGTHRGPLDLGGWIFKPTGRHAILSLRELLEVRDDTFVFSGLSFDVQQMVEQLTRVDTTQLLSQIDRIEKLGHQLASALEDPERTKELIAQLGREIDAARHTVRPYFKRQHRA